MRHISILLRQYTGLILGTLVIGLSVYMTFGSNSSLSLFKPATPFSKVSQTDIHRLNSQIFITLQNVNESARYNFSELTNQMNLPHRSKISLIYSTIMLRFYDRVEYHEIIKRRLCDYNFKAYSQISLEYLLDGTVLKRDVLCP